MSTPNIVTLFTLAVSFILQYNNPCLGYWSDLAPPFHIPNKVVKQISADDTHCKARVGKVGRSQDFFWPKFIDTRLFRRWSCSFQLKLYRLWDLKHTILYGILFTQRRRCVFGHTSYTIGTSKLRN